MASASLSPLHVFRFQVDFFTDSLSDDDSHEQFQVCSGSFAECTGLEATMEPKVIKEGGRNYGAAQRAGGTTFATVVLKRGISNNQNLYQIFNSVSTGTFAPRMQVTINVFDIDGSAIVWARDMGDAANRELLDYFRGRQVWLVEADTPDPQPVPYSPL